MLFPLYDASLSLLLYPVPTCSIKWPVQVVAMCQETNELQKMLLNINEVNDIFTQMKLQICMHFHHKTLY